MKLKKRILSGVVSAAMLIVMLPSALATSSISVTLPQTAINAGDENLTIDTFTVEQSTAGKVKITANAKVNFDNEEILWTVAKEAPDTTGGFDWDGYKMGGTEANATPIAGLGDSEGVQMTDRDTTCVLREGAADMDDEIDLSGHLSATADTTFYLVMLGTNDTKSCYTSFVLDKSGVLQLPKATATAAIGTPATDDTYLNDTGLATFAGTAINGTTGTVSKVQWALQDSNNKYLNGSNFDSDAPVWDDATGTSSWTLDLSGKSLDDGDYTLSIVALDDNAGVSSNKVVTRTFKVDNTAPTVTSIVRTANAAEVTKTTPVSFTVTYDEAVKGVAATDFVITNGSFGSAAGTSGRVDATAYYTGWTVTVTPSSDGEIKLATATASWTAEDQAGNTVAANQNKSATYTYDTTAPVIATIKVGGASGTDIQAGAATNSALSGTIEVAITEANPVITGNVSDLNDVNGVAIVKSANDTTAETGKITAAAFGEGGKLTITYSGLEVNTPYKLVIGANVIADLAGNKLAAATTSANAFTTTNGIAVEPTFADGSATINKVYGGEKFTNAAMVNAATYPGASATVGYTSSDTSVAVVDADTGVVTIKGAGTATITATTSNISGDKDGTPYVTGSKSYTLEVARKDIQTNLAALSFSKEYDGANTLALAELQESGSGSVEGGPKYYLATGVGDEKLEITAITATYNATNKGESVGATATAITFADNATDALVANYKIDNTNLSSTGVSTSLSSVSLHGAITAKALTWKGSTAAMSGLDKVYDGTRTAKVTGVINENANTYLDGVASGDQSNVKLTIAVGEYADAYAAADVADQDVTLPASALSLTGSGADNYTLPVSGTGIKAAITQATPTFRIAENGTQVELTTAKSGATPQVSLDGGTTWKALADLGLTLGTSGAGKVQLEYWVATPPTDLIHCDCGYGNAQGHLLGCTGVANNDASQCNCAALAGNRVDSWHATSALTDLTKIHAADCAYATTPETGKCDCGLGDGDAANISGGSHDWNGGGVTTETCSYAAYVPAGGSWVSYDSAATYLSGLAVGDTVKVKIYMATANTNLAAVSDPGAAEGNSTDSFTVIADPVIPSGGGSVSGYTVKYNAGKNGKLAEGAKASERVKKGESPVAVPEVVANDGWKFLGWSLDGKTVVDPTGQEITKNVTFTALYAEKPVVAFNKDLTTPYIKGILNEATGEYYFNPDAGMSRAEMAAIVARTLINKMDETKSYDVSMYSDVESDAWYADYIGFLTELGVLTGYTDGSFHPEQSIARSEFVAMVMRVDGVVNGENPFPDVQADDWALEFIVSASVKGYVDGTDDGTFQPTRSITRAEAVKVMNAVLGWDWETEGEMIFPDVPELHWAYNDIIKASTGK